MLPHDLLRIRRLPELSNEPIWVREAIRRAPFVVVRRAAAPAGQIAVGVRGPSRAHRYATFVEEALVEAFIAPEALVARVAPADRHALPAFAALAALRETEALDVFVWGPCGSVGFELATGLPTVTETSDLDLLIRAPTPLSPETVAALCEALAPHAGLDVQLETPAGGVALHELASGKRQVLARNAHGPRLVAQPWAP